MRSHELNKEIADQMLLKAGRLDVEQSEYICFQTGHGTALIEDEDHFCQILFHK